MRFSLILLAAGILFQSCSILRKQSLNKSFRQTEQQFQDHTGFVLYDLQEQKTLYEFNSAKYFTPASNTKIFTLFASLNIIGDSIPALRYVQQSDSLIFWGTADPSFLNKNVFNNNRLYSFLTNAKENLYFSSSNFNTTAFGPGWAWDDYNDAYSPERFSLPIYGNTFSVQTIKSKVIVTPAFFAQHRRFAQSEHEPVVVRNLDSNAFTYYPSVKPTESEIPFKTNPTLVAELLRDTLHRSVDYIQRNLDNQAKTLYSLPADSLYKVMMQESDNLIAEHLLMMCAGIVSDTLKPEIAIDYIQKNFLADLKDEAIWVDGSGLSRYNLFTPRTIVQLWNKIYKLVPRERLFAMLAIGGKTGTLKNWYKADTPYIFGKTGSLSNNHCLSGYLVTKSGKTLIFSFMNSNFTAPTAAIRTNMQQLLNMIYEKY